MHGLAGLDLRAMQGRAREAAALMKALASEPRLILLCSLAEDEMAVTPLAEKVGLSQSALSQHLARLRELDIVETRREGQTIKYRLKDTIAARIIAVLHDEFCPPKHKPGLRPSRGR